ncbi:hypothetical protein M427DRAFT_398526 [Gonapodya prolifera JEL478]|uniref:Uncharacterized protein n=1 Tax=Gonapodya prolifera (strain JEL478) TaxID=1344416 RepID=A0A139A6D4_GONPJ|nr:hypothetical protein M427DRAFT_398526 [Gonapodya prolifera JEL478]|eukprot:KXS12294.1 hypothetical protein M427DRAFT_398526 [Gonapodya prolifera JEL478]
MVWNSSEAEVAGGQATAKCSDKSCQHSPAPKIRLSPHNPHHQPPPTSARAPSDSSDTSEQRRREWAGDQTTRRRRRRRQRERDRQRKTLTRDTRHNILRTIECDRTRTTDA